MLSDADRVAILDALRSDTSQTVTAVVERILAAQREAIASEVEEVLAEDWLSVGSRRCPYPREAIRAAIARGGDQ